FQAVAIPSAASIAASEVRGMPPMFANVPVANIVLATTAIESISPSGLGFHEVAKPFTELTAARLVRKLPPMLVKWPPTIKFVPETANALTGGGNTFGSGRGFQLVTAPVPTSTAARLFRTTPPTLVKAPPR